jgi:dienelactone hydrolase
VRDPRLAFAVGAGVVALLVGLPSDRLHATDTAYRVVRPDARGPHPAIVFLSGCDGFAPAVAPKVYERRAEQFRALGHVVVFADYLGRRGLKSCAGPVTHEDAAQELVAAAGWARSQRDVDPARITAMGWSYGGRGVLVALMAPRPPPFTRAVVYYPDCRGLRPWKGSLPVLMLLGGADDMTPAALCEEVTKKVSAPAAVKIVVYPGALHAFDVPELPAMVSYGLATIGHHPQAAAAARVQVEQFLAGR